MNARDEARAALRRAAEAQRDAYATMVEIGEGIGGLAIRHPEMSAAMHAWSELTENDHADIVLALLDETEPTPDEREALAILREALTVDIQPDHLYAAVHVLVAKVTDAVAALERGHRQGPITDAMVDAAIKAWWDVPLKGVRGMQGVAMRAALEAAEAAR